MSETMIDGGPRVGEALQAPASDLLGAMTDFAGGIAGRFERFGVGDQLARGGLVDDISARWAMPIGGQSFEVIDSAYIDDLLVDWAATADGYDDLIYDLPSSIYVIPIDPVEDPTGFGAQRVIQSAGRRAAAPGALQAVPTGLRPQRQAARAVKEQWRVAESGGLDLLTPYPAAMGRAGAIEAGLLRFPDARAEISQGGRQAVIVDQGPGAGWAPRALNTFAPAMRAAELAATRGEQFEQLESQQAPATTVGFWLVEAEGPGRTSELAYDAPEMTPIKGQRPPAAQQLAEQRQTRRPGQWQQIGQQAATPLLAQRPVLIPQPAAPTDLGAEIARGVTPSATVSAPAALLRPVLSPSPVARQATLSVTPPQRPEAPATRRPALPQRPTLSASTPLSDLSMGGRALAVGELPSQGANPSAAPSVTAAAIGGISALSSAAALVAQRPARQPSAAQGQVQRQPGLLAQGLLAQGPSALGPSAQGPSAPMAASAIPGALAPSLSGSLTPAAQAGQALGARWTPGLHSLAGPQRAASFTARLSASGRGAPQRQISMPTATAERTAALADQRLARLTGGVALSRGLGADDRGPSGLWLDAPTPEYIKAARPQSALGQPGLTQPPAARAALGRPSPAQQGGQQAGPQSAPPASAPRAAQQPAARAPDLATPAQTMGAAALAAADRVAGAPAPLTWVGQRAAPAGAQLAAQQQASQRAARQQLTAARALVSAARRGELQRLDPVALRQLDALVGAGAPLQRLIQAGAQLDAQPSVQRGAPADALGGVGPLTISRPNLTLSPITTGGLTQRAAERLTPSAAGGRPLGAVEGGALAQRPAGIGAVAEARLSRFLQQIGLDQRPITHVAEPVEGLHLADTPTADHTLIQPVAEASEVDAFGRPRATAQAATARTTRAQAPAAPEAAQRALAIADSSAPAAQQIQRQAEQQAARVLTQWQKIAQSSAQRSALSRLSVALAPAADGGAPVVQQIIGLTRRLTALGLSPREAAPMIRGQLALSAAAADALPEALEEITQRLAPLSQLSAVERRQQIDQLPPRIRALVAIAEAPAEAGPAGSRLAAEIASSPDLVRSGERRADLFGAQGAGQATAQATAQAAAIQQAVSRQRQRSFSPPILRALKAAGLTDGQLDQMIQQGGRGEGGRGEGGLSLAGRLVQRALDAQREGSLQAEAPSATMRLAALLGDGFGGPVGEIIAQQRAKGDPATVSGASAGAASASTASASRPAIGQGARLKASAGEAPLRLNLNDLISGGFSGSDRPAIGAGARLGGATAQAEARADDLAGFSPAFASAPGALLRRGTAGEATFTAAHQLSEAKGSSWAEGPIVGGYNLDKALVIYDRAQAAQAERGVPLPQAPKPSRGAPGALASLFGGGDNVQISGGAGLGGGFSDSGGLSGGSSLANFGMPPVLLGGLFGDRGPAVASDGPGPQAPPSRIMVDTGKAAAPAPESVLRSTPGERPGQKAETTEESRHRLARNQVDDQLSDDEVDKIAEQVIYTLKREVEMDNYRYGEDEWD